MPAYTYILKERVVGTIVCIYVYMYMTRWEFKALASNANCSFSIVDCSL